VKFKQLQALKKRAYEAFAQGSRLDVPRQDASRLDSITLAFVGDAQYALYLRHRLVDTAIPNVQVLHLLAAEFVSAKAQAHVYRHLKTMLNDEEKAVCQRARNAHSQVPKSASVAEYHDSTALEALTGYLVMSNQSKRLDEVLDRVYVLTKEYCALQHGGKV
jgi:ribonuclease-3 family protein